MTAVLVDAAELAARVPRCSPARVQEWLDAWAERGIVEEREPGRYALTRHGHELAQGLLAIDVEGDA